MIHKSGNRASLHARCKTSHDTDTRRDTYKSLDTKAVLCTDYNMVLVNSKAIPYQVGRTDIDYGAGHCVGIQNSLARLTVPIRLYRRPQTDTSARFTRAAIQLYLHTTAVSPFHNSICRYAPKLYIVHLMTKDPFAAALPELQ